MPLPVDDTALTVIDGQGWSCVDFVSDLHLQATEPATWRAFHMYLQQTPAEALFVLGDLFEVWIGDDLLQDARSDFERQVCAALNQAARRLSVYWMVGNRDFLTGQAFADASGVIAVADPCVLRLGDQMAVLSHGDALCLSDRDYMAFRKQVRQAAWRQAFLARPLDERQTQARQMREQSQSRQQSMSEYADVDEDEARQLLLSAGAQDLIHGHTHRPGDHDLGAGLTRRVLSDWCADAQPARLQVLRWSGTGGGSKVEGQWQRLAPLASTQK
jgi:UDP-2,3-diacylglucosamine hydrolase